MRISDWSSDVCSSDLGLAQRPVRIVELEEDDQGNLAFTAEDFIEGIGQATAYPKQQVSNTPINAGIPAPDVNFPMIRSEEHTSELQSLMRISYAVFCLKKKMKTPTAHTFTNNKIENHYHTITQPHLCCTT